MRRQAFCLLLLALGGCATLEKHPNPMSADDVIALARSGASSKDVIAAIFRTDTLIPLNAAEVVRMHEGGVQNEVIDYLQLSQIEEMRWRDRFANSYWPGPIYRGYGPCPWPSSRRYRGGPWSC